MTNEWTQPYEEMFGFVPEHAAARIELQAEVAPEVLAALEAYRAAAFNDDALDPITTQLISFSVLLALGRPAARNHAVAARRAGATWEQLQAAATLASVFGALGPANAGGQLLRDLRATEATT